MSEPGAVILQATDLHKRFREGRGWKRNQLRKYCGEAFLNYRRVTEWANVHDELKELVARELKWQVNPLAESTEKSASYDSFHRALLAGVPLVAGVSAPSSLAVDLARETGITLCGFVRGTTMNIYTHPQRITR